MYSQSSFIQSLLLQQSSEYGINGLFVGVPVKLGANGIEEIIQINLTTDERSALHRSAAAVQELVNVLGR